MNVLSIVVPCYNEEEVLSETSKRLSAVLDRLIQAGKISADSYVLFVDDGSKDKTWEIISSFNGQSNRFRGLKLAANAGHQSALFAGLMAAKEDADITVSIDADLQDDTEVIDQMVDKYLEGCEIVYGVRDSRKTDTFFKRNTAKAFYKLMSSLGAKSMYNHADFRLMSKKAVCCLENYRERNLFLRGIVPLIGFKTDTVTYNRSARFAGESKYPLKKMLSFAIDGITSFSIRPITLIAVLGFVIVLCSIAAFIYALVSYFTGHSVAGWASIIISIWFLGGVQLLSIGLIGQYIGKIYIEVKDRPRYNIEKYLK